MVFFCLLEIVFFGDLDFFGDVREFFVDFFGDFLGEFIGRFILNRFLLDLVFIDKFLFFFLGEDLDLDFLFFLEFFTLNKFVFILVVFEFDFRDWFGFILKKFFFLFFCIWGWFLDFFELGNFFLFEFFIIIFFFFLFFVLDDIFDGFGLLGLGFFRDSLDFFLVVFLCFEDYFLFFKFLIIFLFFFVLYIVLNLFELFCSFILIFEVGVFWSFDFLLDLFGLGFWKSWFVFVGFFGDIFMDIGLGDFFGFCL